MHHLFCRLCSSDKATSLEEFVAQHDSLMNSSTKRQSASSDIPSEIPSTTPSTCLRSLLSHAHLTIMNNFETIADLEAHLDEVNLLDSERMRPGWDGYFMVS
jgi:dCMP deaminase